MDKNNHINVDTLIFDLDGTLLNSEKKVLPSSIEAIKKIHHLNKKAMIATGRPWYFTKQIIHDVNLDPLVISCNGALIYDMNKQKVVYKKPIKKTIAKHFYEYLIKNKVNFLIYTDLEMFAYKGLESSEWINWLHQQNNSFDDQNKFSLTLINYQLDIDKYDVIKFLVIDSELNSEKQKIILKELQTYANNWRQEVYLIKSQKTVIDIMPADCFKGKAIAELGNLNLLDINKTVVFGDEVNDLSMFENVKYSVAMGNSNQEIKEAATFVTDSNNENGIANFINKYIFK